MTDDTVHLLNDNRSQPGYDEYLHICCYAFFDSCANTAISEGMDVMSSDPSLLTEQMAAVTLITAGHRTHATTEEAARTRSGFLRLTKGGQTSSDSDRVFAELAHEHFCRPRPTAVSGPLDELPQRFVQALSTKRSKFACMPPARQQLEQRSRRQRHISYPDKTPRPRRRQPTNARPQPQQQ
jgi:hypothetical protein